MATFTNQETRLLTVATPLGEDVLLLTGFSGREELSRPFTYELEFLSEEEAIAPRDIIGKGVTWSVNHQDDEPRHFHGIVRRFVAGGLHVHGLRTYRAEVVPWLWFLTRTSNCRIFQNKTSPQIIESLFKEYGFKDYKPALKRSYPPWEYCVQYRESAFHFISRLLEHEGIFYYFRHEEGKHTLVLADHRGAYKDCAENQVAYSAGSLASNHIDAWEHQCEFRSGRWAHTDYNFETPSASLLTSTNTLMKLPGVDKFEVFDYPGDFRDKKEGEADAKIRMEEEEAGHDVVAGAGTCCTFTPGGKFTLETHDIASEAGKSYVLTSVEHMAADASYGQNGEVSTYRNRFTCIPDTVIFRPARVTPQPVVHGPQTAVVVGPVGEKIFCDNYGRIKVQFHWDRLGRMNEESSCWVRVSQNWGGAKWGGVFIPHVGQEVIVEFEEGDPDRPLITGRVYNAEIMPPLELPDHKTKSVIRDHGGNQIIMEGHDGVQQIKMYSPYAETEFIMGAPHSPGDGFFLRTKHFFESIIGKNSTETVMKNKTVMVGGRQVEAVARSRSEVTKGMRVEMTKGRMTETVQGKVVIVNAKDRSETIRGAQTVQVKKKQTELTERDREAMVKGDYKMESEQLISLRGKKIYAGGTEEVVIQDGKQIILQCGESKITLKQNGTVIIQGNAIHFIAKKDIQAVAKENLTLKGGTFALKSSTGAGEVNAKATLDVKGQMVKINC